MKFLKWYVWLLLVFIAIWPFLLSCTTGPGNTVYITNTIDNSAGLKLKSYMGAASIGDVISYGVDYTNNQLVFSNITRQYTWIASFSLSADGSYRFTVPVINKTAYFIEVPNKVLAVAFWILRGFEIIPSLAVLTPNTIQSSADLAVIQGSYFQMMASRINTNNYLDGLYNFEMGATYVTTSNFVYYTNGGATFSSAMTGPIIFTNNMAYSVTPITTGSPISNTNYINANGQSYVADLGTDNGFAFGINLRTNALTLADVSGKYMCMNLEQMRNPMTTNLSMNLISRFYILLSNNGAHLDVYSSTNNSDGSFTNLLSTLVLTNQPGSGYLPSMIYYLISTNSNGNQVVAVPSSDLSMAGIGLRDGNPYDTNSSYHIMYGFCKKL